MSAGLPEAAESRVAAKAPRHRHSAKRDDTREYVVQRNDLSERPRFAAAASEDLLTGARLLRRAFYNMPLRYAGREASAFAYDKEVAAVQMATGFGFSSCVLADGRRAILDILVPGDIAGLDRLAIAGPGEEITMVGRAGFRTLGIATLREQIANPNVAAYVMAVVAEARWRALRLAAAIGRLDAQARLCVLLLDLHDRLRRRDLIAHSTYNLPLTQEQLADHLGLTLVHVNRTLRRLREERIAMVDRQVVIIQDMARLRQYAQGLPELSKIPEPALPG